MEVKRTRTAAVGGQGGASDSSWGAHGRDADTPRRNGGGGLLRRASLRREAEHPSVRIGCETHGCPVARASQVVPADIQFIEFRQGFEAPGEFRQAVEWIAGSSGLRNSRIKHNGETCFGTQTMTNKK